MKIIFVPDDMLPTMTLTSVKNMHSIAQPKHIYLSLVPTQMFRPFLSPSSFSQRVNNQDWIASAHWSILVQQFTFDETPNRYSDDSSAISREVKNYIQTIMVRLVSRSRRRRLRLTSYHVYDGRTRHDDPERRSDRACEFGMRSA